MPSASSPATIVFDLDGTLAETAPDIIATLNVILAREGLAPCRSPRRATWWAREPGR